MNTQQGRLYQKLEIGVASPKQIQSWADRYLPNNERVGEVTSWETLNYKTLKPEPDGLFCQKIFGPVVDFNCACGKKSTKIIRGICIQCGVERTHSKVRRYRMGYIKLKQPVAHAMYASHRPSPIALCLNWSTRRVQFVMRTLEFCCLPPAFRTFCSHYEAVRLFGEKTNKPIRKNIYLLKLLYHPAIPPNNVIPSPLPNRMKRRFVERGPTAISSPGPEKPETHVVLSKKRGAAVQPRLFTTEKQKRAHRKLVFNQGAGEIRLYGITYDCTWRRVDEFQEFLFYLWEQSFSYESSIPYYSFTKQVENHSSEIPNHHQSYAIQTGGFVFQKILSHLDASALQLELRSLEYLSLQILEVVKETLESLNYADTEDRKHAKRLRNT